MCICGAIPDRDQCGTCAVPADLTDPAFEPHPDVPRPPLDYDDEEPF